MSAILTSEPSVSEYSSTEASQQVSEEPLRQYCLAQLDIPVWLDRQSTDFESKLQTIFTQSIDTHDSYDPEIEAEKVEVELEQKSIEENIQPISAYAQETTQTKNRINPEEQQEEQPEKQIAEQEIERLNESIPEQAIKQATRPEIGKEPEFKSNLTDQKNNSSLISEIDNSPEHLLELNQQIKQCQRCNQRNYSHQALLGRYLFQHKEAPTLCLLVESPSDAEFKNRHFIANDYGSLLNNILLGMGLGEFNVYATGLLKCHAPDQHQVISEEIDACHSYIMQELELIDADIVVTLGNFSFHHLFKVLLNTDFPEENGLSLSQIREDKPSTRKIVFENKQIPLVSTFHPDFLSRHNAYKAQSQDDWLIVRNYLVSLQSAQNEK